MVKKIVLSMDISSKSTGWCVFKNDLLFDYGTIQPNGKLTNTEKLHFFRQELINILTKYKPNAIVFEDVFSGINVRTMKLLSKFAGVAEEVCFDVLSVIPYIISNSTVKSYFKARDKKVLFEFVTCLLSFKGWSFKETNDITDSIAQAMCFIDIILEQTHFRYKEVYGFRYVTNSVRRFL